MPLVVEMFPPAFEVVEQRFDAPAAGVEAQHGFGGKVGFGGEQQAGLGPGVFSGSKNSHHTARTGVPCRKRAMATMERKRTVCALP